MTTLTCFDNTVIFGSGCSTLLINDQLRIMDQDSRVLKELSEGRLDALMELAKTGLDKGIRTVDVLINHPNVDEIALLPQIARRLNEELGCFILLDSRNPAALDAALAILQPSKAMINSITAEAPLLESLLPLAQKYHAALVGMPIGEKFGLPKTVQGRLAEAEVILEAAAAAGVLREDVVIDAVCLASSAEPDSFQVTLETLQELKRIGVTSILGIGNAGFGMPQATVVDMAYLIGAIPWGLNAALVNPMTSGLVETVLAVDFLLGRDPGGRQYIRQYRENKKKQ